MDVNDKMENDLTIRVKMLRNQQVITENVDKTIRQIGAHLPMSDGLQKLQ